MENYQIFNLLNHYIQFLNTFDHLFLTLNSCECVTFNKPYSKRMLVLDPNYLI